MDDFLQTLYMEADLESIQRRFRMRDNQLKTFESFDEIDLNEFCIGRLNRWSIATDAIRSEAAFRNAETIYGERLVTVFGPLAGVVYLQRIAQACVQGQPLQALQLVSGMNAFSSLTLAIIQSNHQPYLGRAGLVLQSYGLTLTAHLPQLNLAMEKY